MTSTSNRFTRWLKDGLFIWLVLLDLARVYVLPGLVSGPPLPEYRYAWSLQEEPWVGSVIGGCCVAVLIVLWLIPPHRQGARRILRWVTGIASIVGSFFFPPTMLLYFTVPPDWDTRLFARKNEPATATPRPLPGPRISPLVLIVPLLLAGVATLVHLKWTTGAFLSRPTPEEWLLRSHHYLSAAPVMSPPTEGGSRVLLPDPRVTRERLLEHVRNERTGWWAAQVLQKLEERKRLADLPLTDEARVRALPLDSDVLVTPGGTPLTTHPLWGVVVEAEGLQKQRLVLVSLGADDPALSPAPTYGLLFEESATGGPPRLLSAEHVFPSATGSLGVSPRSLFLLYLLGFLLAALPVAAGLHFRALRAPRPASPSEP